MTRRVVTEGTPRCERCRFAPRWCICEGFRALELGASSVYCSASPRIIEAMAREGLPVVGHLGMIPRHVTWTGYRAIGKTEAEALRFLQAGARGILRKTAGVGSVVSCLRTVAAGRSWMEDCVFRDTARPERYSRSELTSREQQVLELVEQGFKNKEMAEKMFISEQTVKNHLHNIFDKLGVSDRLELALYAIHKGLHLAADAPKG